MRAWPAARSAERYPVASATSGIKPPSRRHPQSRLAPKLSALSEYLRWNTSLPPRLSELAILITAREWTAQYEWFAHYPLALKGGLDPEGRGRHRRRQASRQHEG